MGIFDRVKSSSLREQVVEQIRTAIIEGRLKPDDHIVEKDLTDQLGVSRTPVREALILLEREGLVTSVPNRGSFVRAFNENDIAAIFSMRTTLENFAAELCIEKLNEIDLERLEKLVEQQKKYIERGDFKNVRSTDMIFHQSLIEKANHPLLMRSWEELVAQIAAVLYIRAEAFPDYNEYLAVSDHKKILDALSQRDLNAVKYHHKQINNRVAGECQRAIQALTGK